MELGGSLAGSEHVAHPTFFPRIVRVLVGAVVETTCTIEFMTVGCGSIMSTPWLLALAERGRPQDLSVMSGKAMLHSLEAMRRLLLRAEAARATLLPRGAFRDHERHFLRFLSSRVLLLASPRYLM